MKATSLEDTPALQGWDPRASGVQVSAVGGSWDGPVVKSSYPLRASPLLQGLECSINTPKFTVMAPCDQMGKFRLREAK